MHMLELQVDRFILGTTFITDNCTMHCICSGCGESCLIGHFLAGLLQQNAFRDDASVEFLSLNVS